MIQTNQMIDIKTKVIDMLLNDDRIIKLFNNKNEYLGKNIFPYLSNEHYSFGADACVFFDIEENIESYKLIFEVKSHEDISCCIPNNLDKVTQYIQEDIIVAYPKCRDFCIFPTGNEPNFVEKGLWFYLYKNEISAIL